jgi:parallel beta-helix repeat protein
VRNSIVAMAGTFACLAATTAAGLTLPVSAIGASYYVSTAGSDSYPGTDSLPFRTLNRAASGLKPGDTLFVKPGVYSESLHNAIPSGLDASNPVTVRAQDSGNRPVLRPSSGSRVLQLEFWKNQPLHHVVIDGLVIDATNVSGDAVKVTTGAHHITLRNSEVKGAPSNGILLTGSATGHNVFSNLDIHHNGDDFEGHGIYVSASNNVIEKCNIHENSAWGVHVYGDDGGVNANTVRGNYVWGNGRVLSRGVGIGLYSGNDHLAYNNVVWKNNGGGIAVNYGAARAGVYNNTVYGNGSAVGILIGQQSSSTKAINNIVSDHESYGIWNMASASGEIRNNLTYRNDDGNIRDSAGSTAQSGNLNADPQYQNAAGGDFKLRSTSPAAGIGLPTSIVTTDITGAARPQSPTLGAFELAAAAPPPPSGPAPPPAGPAPPPTDSTGPSISGVTVLPVSATSAIFYWTTSEPSNSQVEYGLTASYGSLSTLDPNMVTEHSLSVAGLQAGTRYQFRVRSRDAASNLAVSQNFSFTTAGSPPGGAPAPPPAERTFYVAPGGNDGATGSSQQPFRTLNRAVSALKPGDLLLIQPGTYAESLHNVIPSGTSTEPVTIRAADPNNRPVLRPSSGASNVVRLEFYRSSPVHHVVLDGLVLDATNVSLDAVKITTGANNITIANTEVRNAPNNGILLTGTGTEHNTFRNLDVHHNGDRYQGHGLYISTSNNVIEGSRVHANSAWGVHVYSDGVELRNNIVRGNQVYDNGRVVTRGVGIGLYSGNGQAAYNNVVWNNSGGGIAVNYGSRNASVSHNTLYGNGGEAGIIIGSGSTATQVLNNIVADQSSFGIYHLSSSSGTVIRCNLLYRTQAVGVYDQSRAASVSSNLVADPQFQNAANGNFKPRSTSPAIDMGASASVSEDFDGNSRPKGSAPDAGAFETR